MDKNVVLAFVLMIGAFLFFNSDFYNYSVLKKEKPDPVRLQFVRDSLAREREKARTSARPKGGDSAEAAAAQTASSPATGAPLSLPSLLSPAVDTALPQAGRVVVEGKKFTAEISRRGALLSAWHLPEYVDREGRPINLIPPSSGGMLNLHLNGRNLDTCLFSTAAPETLRLTGGKTLVMRYDAPEGWWVEKRFALSPDQYDFGFAFRCGGVKEPNYTVGWRSGILETEENVSSTYTDDPVTFFYGGDIDHPVGKKDTLKEVEGATRWIALSSTYFAGVFLLDHETDLLTRARKLKAGPASKNELNFSLELVSGLERAGEEDGAGFRVILCPKQYSVLKGFGVKLEKILFSGYSWFFKADIWFPPLCGLVLSILNFFYRLIPNYGIAIIFLTILSRIVTFPLTWKSTKSMARMKALQPRMEAIRQRYKSDPMTMNKSIMKLYKEEGVNPLSAGGCLPIFLQMPVFISLFVTLRKAIELRGAPFMLWIKDLSAPEAMFMLPAKILFYGPNVSLLNVFMSITMYFQSKQTVTDPRQKATVILMPIMMFFMFNGMPAGLILYWAVSNVLGIAQNKMIKPAAPPAKAAVVKQ